GEGQEVHVAQVAHRRGAEHHRLAGLDHHGTARLPGKLARLEGDLALADIHRNAANVKHAHLVFTSGRPVGGPNRFRTLVLCRQESTHAAACPKFAVICSFLQARQPKSAGVAVTPARTPDSKSRRTRAATASERRSASKRSRSSPSALARSHRCG